VPDGVYAAEKYLAPWDFGSAEGEPSVTLAVRVVVEGEELTLDFTGTTDQVTRSVNSVAPFTRAYAIYALRLLLTPGIPHNEGFARPAHVVTREGSALAAARPHACLARHVIGHHVPDLVNLALAEALPERARAESGSSPAWTLVLTPLEGRYQNVPRLFGLAGGTGARRESAGQTIMYPVNIGTSSVEMLERTLPIRFVEKSMRPETAGAGRAEGGCGQHVEIDTLGPMIYTFMAGNIRHRPRGLDGGTAGAAGSAEIDKTPISPGSGRVGAGSTFVLQTPGGGGYGAVPDRERAVPGAEDESARAAAGGGRATAPPGDPLRAKVAAGGSRAAPMSSTAGSP
jgi:N-methylhydantoinase B